MSGNEKHKTLEAEVWLAATGLLLNLFPIAVSGRFVQAMNTTVMTKEKGQQSIAAFHNTPVITENRQQFVNKKNT